MPSKQDALVLKFHEVVLFWLIYKGEEGLMQTEGQIG